MDKFEACRQRVHADFLNAMNGEKVSYTKFLEELDKLIKLVREDEASNYNYCKSCKYQNSNGFGVCGDCFGRVPENFEPKEK